MSRPTPKQVRARPVFPDPPAFSLQLTLFYSMEYHSFKIAPVEGSFVSPSTSSPDSCSQIIAFLDLGIPPAGHAASRLGGVPLDVEQREMSRSLRDKEEQKANCLR